MTSTVSRDEVLALSRVETEPAVSILLPIQRHAPLHEPDRLHLRHLADAASDVVLRSYPAEDAESLVTRLRAIVDDVDLDHPGDGLAVFVSADEDHVMNLPFPVEEQLCIERVFATRQVLIGLAHEPPARVLVLSQDLVRLFEDRDRELVEVRAGGFPLAAPHEPELEPPHHDLPRHDEIEHEEHRSTYRAAAAALDELDRGTPLVIVGAERELAFFDEVAHDRLHIIGHVHGSYADASPTEIEQAVRPAIERYVRSLQDDAVREITEPVDRDRVVTDFPKVWRAVMEGRGHRLVIEEDFTFPLHLTDGYTPGAEPDEPWTLDDAVDALIEHVVLAGGEITFVRPGTLAAEHGIGLVLRY